MNLVTWFGSYHMIHLRSCDPHKGGISLRVDRGVFRVSDQSYRGSERGLTLGRVDRSTHAVNEECQDEYVLPLDMVQRR